MLHMRFHIPMMSRVAPDCARDWSKVTHQDAVQLVHQIEGGALLQKKDQKTKHLNHQQG